MAVPVVISNPPDVTIFLSEQDINSVFNRIMPFSITGDGKWEFMIPIEVGGRFIKVKIKTKYQKVRVGYTWNGNIVYAGIDFMGEPQNKAIIKMTVSGGFNIHRLPNVHVTGSFNCSLGFDYDPAAHQIIATLQRIHDVNIHNVHESIDQLIKNILNDKFQEKKWPILIPPIKQHIVNSSKKIEVKLEQVKIEHNGIRFDFRFLLTP